MKFPCKYANVHSMSLTTFTKFHEILLSGLEELRWQIISEHLILAKFACSKGALLAKKDESEFPANLHIDLHIMYFITTKFHEILFSGFRGVALTNCFCSIFL